MMLLRVRTAWVAAILWMAAPPASAGEAVDYARDVKPILKKSCYACHGSLKQEGGLRLDTAELALRGGDSGASIEPGDSSGSFLMDRIKDDDESSRMPQEGSALTAEAIAKIAAWIDQGAAAPKDEQPEADPRDHWAFRRPVRPDLPQVPDAGLRIRTPIDAFVAAKYREQGVVPVGEASKTALLRRLYLDLIGLPPTRDDLHAFLADESPDAYEKVVDRLLASPQYGERWGRHWMDVWRYSDWYGRRSVPDVMNSYPTIWRWRDWIVRSLNEDKGYDRMIVEMLAADEVAPGDDDALVATGFLVRNWFKWNYSQWMKDNVEHTGKAFLGLTFNCAHCHDHKYDPISHRDYFAMRAFFEPLELRQDRVPGGPDPGRFKEYVYGQADAPIAGGMIRVFDKKLDAQTKMYSRGDERSLIEGEPPVEPGLPAIFDFAIPPVMEIELPPVAAYPGLKPFIVHEELAKAAAAIPPSEQRATDAQAKLQAEEAPLVAAVEAAQAELAKLKQSLAQQKPGALSGANSLYVDARQGRRAMSYDASALGAVQNGATFSFQLLIEADAHANFQLARDPATGATAAFVGFEQGRIITYAPGTVEIVEIGHYNLAGGQSRFQVTATLDVAGDRMAIEVGDLVNGQKLVDGAAGALNGWNPGADPRQGILFDVRPGAVVAFDEITLAHPGEPPVIKIDFEEPAYARDQDAAGKWSWSASPFCVAPAISLVSNLSLALPEYATARQNLRQAERRLEALRLAAAAGQADVAAAKAELASLEERIAAGEARFAHADNAAELARDASRVERTAAHARALAAENAAQKTLADAEGKPAAAEEITAAQAAYSATQQAVAAAAKSLEADSDQFTLLAPNYPEKSTGRRTMLAAAIANRENPLTARVAMNHIWMRHFGRPLVESVFDFGRNGKPPSHPDLLDWLAVELMDSGWSMKHMHRLLVTSSTYRLDTKGAGSPNVAVDPDNKYLWHFHRKRMESELVRDSVLYAAGQLDLAMGGPEVEFKDAGTCRRRSIYLSHHGEERSSLMATFDAADPCDCYRRIESVVPQQALAIANGDLAVESSRVLARRLWTKVSAEVPTESDRVSAFVAAVFEQLLSRAPTPEESAVAVALIADQSAVFGSVGAIGEEPAADDGTRPSIDPAMRARESLAHALLSHHDFISIR